jgi:hypothetical protein
LAISVNGPSAELVEHDPGGVQVAPSVDLARRHLLGRHVLRSADRRAGLGRGLSRRRRIVGQAGDAEVGDLYRALVREEHVLRFHVAVDDGVPVRIVERLQHAVHNGEHLRQRDLAAVQPVAQRLAADELEDDVVGGADLLHVVELDQVWMAEPRHHLRLLEEALERGGIRRSRGHELFDRHLAAQARLLGEVDGAHAAAAQFPLDDVLADVTLAGR